MTSAEGKLYQTAGRHRRGGGAALSLQIRDLLRERIVTFALRPYEQISEQNIASELGVSRTPVREALVRLSELGLVDIFPQRGTVIAPLRIADLEKSQFLREALEIALLKRAMARPGLEALVQSLKSELAIQSTLVELRDAQRFYASDEEFHAFIAAQAGLGSVVGEVERAKIHMDRFRHLMLAGIEDLPTVLDQHKAIVEAIAANDSIGAQGAMETHLRRVLEFVRRAADKYPDYFESAEFDVPNMRRRAAGAQ
jgi:GntR family transcriptional regulator, rspAB operon transcriptional repressor